MRDHGVDIFTLDGALLLSLDVDLDNSYRLTSTISRNPVDSGLPTTSHIQPENPTLVYNGIITQTPIWDKARFVGLDRVQIHKRVLEALHRAAQTVRVVDGVDVYEPYGFDDIVLNWSGDLGQAVGVSLTMSFFNEVTEDTTEVDPALVAQLKQRTRSRKTTKAANEKQAEATKKTKGSPYGWGGEILGIRQKVSSSGAAVNQMQQTWSKRVR